jgi:hypothetical protein
MSVMSAADAGGVPGPGQEILLRGPGTAEQAAGLDDAGPGESSPDERCAEDGPFPPARSDRRLRLVTTEVHVTKVRVARQVSTRTVRWDGPEVGVPGADGPRTAARPVSAPPVRGPGGTAPRVSAEPVGGARGTTRQVRAEHLSAQRASVQGAAGPAARVQRVTVQRARAQRVSVRRSSVRPGGMRLTRRGRRLLTGLAMLVLVISAMLIWTSVAGGAQTPGPGAPAGSVYQGMTQIVVRPGQTLWSIAVAADPAENPWTAVQQISDVNALNGDEVQAGQLLWVPRG